MLVHNSGEILTMFFAILIGLPLPLLPIQILWMNIVTDGLPALALGVEPPERNFMVFGEEVANIANAIVSESYRSKKSNIPIG